MNLIKKKARRNRTLVLNAEEIPTLEESISNTQDIQKQFHDDIVINDDLYNCIDSIPDNYFDLIIIDPPYNLDKNFNGKKFSSMRTYDYEDYLRSWFYKVCDKLKPEGSLYLCGDWKCSSSLQRVLEEKLTVINRITWQREKGRGAKNNWKNSMEDIWFAVKNPKHYYFNVEAVMMKRKVIATYRENGKPKDWEETAEGNYRTTYPSNFWDDISIPFWSMPENTDHPTQKPEKLYAKLILASSKEGDRIFDPFSGSGTTAVVAKKLKRNYCCVEVNKEYCLWTAKRLQNADKDMSIQGYAKGVFWERNTLNDQGKKLMKLLLVILAGVMVLCGCRKTEERQLPKVYLQTSEAIPWEEYCSCDLDYVTNNDSLNLTGKIKCRGGFSSKYFKHSYSLKLSRPFSFCGLPSNKSWVLNASYIDKTFMRHKICYDLFRMMGDYDMASQCAYILLRENGKPQGLYILMQRLNKHVLQLNTLDTNAMIFKEPKIFRNESSSPSSEAIPTNLHGQTFPDFDKGDDRNYVMDNFRLFLLTASDQEFENHIKEWVDIRNIIDWQLLILFTNNSDGILKNFYFYKQDSETPFRVAIWDCDHSFGRDGDNERNMMERLADCKRSILFNRLMELPDYRQALEERYKQLRHNGIFSYQTIEKMVQENDKYIQLGLNENASLWPYNGDYYFDDNNYEQEKELLLKFVPLSLQRLDSLFNYK